MQEKFNYLYDLIVYVTNNYSSMPDEFRKKFPEALCVNLRLLISDIAIIFENYEK